MKKVHAPNLIKLAIFFGVIFSLSYCSPTPEPSFFVPPTEMPQITPIIVPTATALPTLVPTIIIISPTPICTNNLSFGQDLTVRDGTNVQAGQPIDKQWLVTNSGTCNWDSRYHLKMISGVAMGALIEPALYPARAGTQAKIRILFTAPQDAGIYQSAWQAIAPDGSVFGDPLSINVTVGP